MITLSNENSVKKVKQKALSTGGVIGHPKTEWIFFYRNGKSVIFGSIYFHNNWTKCHILDINQYINLSSCVALYLHENYNMFLQKTELRN